MDAQEGPILRVLTSANKNMAKSLFVCILLNALSMVVVKGHEEICRSSRCEFTFDIRWSRTMTYRHDSGEVHNVVANNSHLTLTSNSWRGQDQTTGSSVNPDDVIIGDGYPRDVIVVNGHFPAPTLHVQHGAKVTVNVYNNLHTEALTLHWYGIDQRTSVWMDGVPYVTQCPIQAGSRFSYKFTAGPVGTHWYGAAEPSLRLDGLSGMIVVHPVPPDLSSEVSVLLSDWYHVDGRVLHTTSPYIPDNMAATGEYVSRHETESTLNTDPSLREPQHKQVPLMTEAGGSGDAEDELIYIKSANSHQVAPVSNIETQDDMPNSPITGSESVHFFNPYSSLQKSLYESSILINGKSGTNGLPSTVLKVKVNHEYRLRLAHSGLSGPYKVSLDNKKFYLAAADGMDTGEIEADLLYIFPGETWDIIIHTPLKAGMSWLHIDHAYSSSVYAKALIVYEEVSEKQPSSELTTAKPDVESSPPAGAEPLTAVPCSPSKPCVHLNCPPSQHPNTTCIRASRLASKDLHPQHYWVRDRQYEEIFLNLALQDGPSINGIRYARPDTPLHLTQGQYENGCSNSDSSCTGNHRIQLPFNQTIDLILTNYEETENLAPLGQFSVHLHGPPFALIEMGYASVSAEGSLVSNPNVTCRSPSCTHTRWHQSVRSSTSRRPVLKNTVLVPALGYSVIRMRTDAPGYWMLESQSDLTGEGGMAVILEVAPDKTDPPPEDHHVCGYSVEEVVLNKIGHREDHVMIKTSHLIGVGVGSLILGMFAALLGVIVAVKAGQGHKKDMPPRHIPTAFHNNSVSRLSSL